MAGEVRDLAQRSATAAKQIKELIGDSVGKVNEGSRLVTESGQTLEEIITSVKKMSAIISEIAAASVEQSVGIEQVNRAVLQLGSMTQQNAAMVKTTASAGEAMGHEAQSLQSLVGFFSLRGQGQGGAQLGPPLEHRPTNSTRASSARVAAAG
ncbi:MAG: methyl-accepting chemotaxis protein [Gammaproteobacteria bacterium]